MNVMSFGRFRLYCSLVYLANQMWTMYLSKRQLNIVATKRSIPAAVQSVMDDIKFQKAALYGARKRRFELFYSLVETIMETAAIYFNGLAMLWSISKMMAGPYQNETVVTSLFLLLAIGITFITSLPFKLYFNFVIETDFGFNKQSVSEFLKDTMKRYLLLAGILIPTMDCLIFIIRWKGDAFFIVAACFVVSVCLGIVFVYPDFIAPIFDDFVPMTECSLKKRIIDLAESVKFPSFNIYIVNGSKKSAHSNAYFTGLFKTRRIVLYDTLVGHLLPSTDTPVKELNSSQMGEDEILAVLAHELGHWKHGHVYKLISVGMLQIFTNFYAYSLLYKWRFMYNAFGFTQEMPLIVGMIVVFGLLLIPIDKVQDLCALVLSRRFERQADIFAVQTRNATDLQNSLIKLYSDNLDYPYYDWLYSACTLNHPPLLERLDAVRTFQSKQN